MMGHRFEHLRCCDYQFPFHIRKIDEHLLYNRNPLRGHLDRLASRGLVVWLSPPGRGRMLTHGLLPPEKLDKVRGLLAGRE